MIILAWIGVLVFLAPIIFVLLYEAWQFILGIAFVWFIIWSFIYLAEYYK